MNDDLRPGSTDEAVAEPISAPWSAGTGRTTVRVPQGACDCHVHLYDPAWPVAADASLSPPPASAADYRKLQQRTGTDRVVFVTPSTYGTDNTCVLAGLHAFGRQARGVAVIGDGIDRASLHALHDAGVRGVRMNLSLGGGPGVEALGRIAQRVADFGWHVQLLMPADALVGLSETGLLRRLPVPLVFDHFGRIPAALPLHRAHRCLIDLLEEGRVWIKFSGSYLLTGDGRIDAPEIDTLAGIYLRVRPDRIVWGSDWPHATASAGRQPLPDDAQQMTLLARWTGGADRLKAVLVDNPAALYGFDENS